MRSEKQQEIYNHFTQIVAACENPVTACMEVAHMFTAVMAATYATVSSHVSKDAFVDQVSALTKNALREALDVSEKMDREAMS